MTGPWAAASISLHEVLRTCPSGQIGRDPAWLVGDAMLLRYCILYRIPLAQKGRQPLFILAFPHGAYGNVPSTRAG